MQKNSKINIKKTTPDNALEWVTVLLMIFLWFFTLYALSDLPKTIPTRFDLMGDPVSFGDKYTLILLPLFGTFTFFSIWLINKFPHKMNIPANITEENAVKVFTHMTKMMRFLNFVVMLLFNYLVVSTYLVAKGINSGIGEYILPFFMLLIFGPIFYYIIKVFENK